MWPISLKSTTVQEIQVENFQRDLFAYLQSVNLIGRNTQIKFCKTEILSRGFPFSAANMALVEKVRHQFNFCKINNLTNIGMLSEANLFFQNDIIIDAYRKITKEIR